MATIRTTEQIAMETVPDLIHQLAKLSTGEQPTTAEIEDAIMTAKALGHALASWASSRHLIQANAQQAARFAEDHPAVAAAVHGLNQVAAVRAYGIPTETPAEREELDRIERAHVSPVFGPCFDLVQRRPA